jgi:hypothetical protein
MYAILWIKFMTVQTSNSQVIYFSRFHPTSYKGGGARRADQVLRVAQKIDAEYQCILNSPASVPSLFNPGHLMNCFLDRYPALKNFIRNLLFWRWSDAFKHSVYDLIISAWLWSRCLDMFPNLKLALIDDPLLLSPLVEALQRRNITYVAIVHNIESLASNQVILKYRPLMLQKELALLKKASISITISREETVLLNNFELNVHYFPYYPANENMQRLKTIRFNRINVHHDEVLMLGNAYNITTLIGMRNFLKLWQSCFKAKDVCLHIAGFGTEQLLPNVHSTHNIMLHGSLPAEKLDNLLMHVNGCICYQNQGSGAMTKIQEFIIAGIPVYANFHAARNYYNLFGIEIFNDIEELVRLIKNNKRLSDSTVTGFVLSDENLLLHKLENILHC